MASPGNASETQAGGRLKGLLGRFRDALVYSTLPNRPFDLTGVGFLLHPRVLLLQGLLLDVLLVAVLHPLDAVHVSQEGPACLVVVAGKGGRGGVTRCRGVHVNIIGKQTLKYK